ncbi:MAG: nucleotidyltransferase domain-containing protein [Candidatus Aenigmatarchaeota archaeon]
MAKNKKITKRAVKKSVKKTAEKPAKTAKSKSKPTPKTKKLTPEQEAKELDDEKLERIDLLKKFTKDVLKEYGQLIRAIVLFGSTARGGFKKHSDIDIFVIVDDTREKITPMLRDKLEDDLDKIAKSCSKKMSVQQPYMLTEFWRLVREGHPIVFNFIREGVPVFDRDMFLPIKRLLQIGEIKPSQEAVEKFIERGPKRIKRVENAKMYMVVEDCYYAMLESAQAVLMFMGKIPPRPTDAPESLRKALVKMKLIDEESVKFLEDIIDLRKKVEHKEVNSVSGADLDVWIEKTKKFVKKMQDTIMEIELIKRENMVEKSYTIMNETAITLLKSIEKAPKKEDPISKAFDTYLVKPGVVSDKYLSVLNELEEMHRIVHEGKITTIPKQDILVNREYVRKFITEAGKILRKKNKEPDV